MIRCIYAQPVNGASDPHPNEPVHDLGSWYGVDRPTLPGRPWIALNMVTSIDGSVAIAGTSGGLGNATDRRILGVLRAAADIVLVGAGTARREGYGPSRKTGQRIAVVTNSGHLDAHSPLFAGGAGLAVTHENAVLPAGIEVVRAGIGEVDLSDAVAQLSRWIPPGGWAILEGGPSLNGSMLSLDLVDEVNVTTAPQLVGGPGPRMITGAPEKERPFELVHQLVDSDHYLFSRWVRRDRFGRPPS